MFTKLQCKSISKEGGLNLSNICDKMGGDVLLVLIGGGESTGVWLYCSFLLLSFSSVRYLMTI